MEKDGEDRRPLTIREYLGAFLPPKRPSREEGESRPEEIRPHIDDFISAARWVGQRVLRLVGRIK